MTHTKANMWRQSQPLDRRPLLRPVTPHIDTGAPKADPTPEMATRIAEQRFGNRADKLLRRFSWQEDGE